MNDFKKNFNLFTFVIGFMIGCSILVIVNAKESPSTSYERNTYSIGTTWTVETWESKPTITVISNEKLTHIVADTRWWISWTNQQHQEISSWWTKLVLVQWFPEVSIATNIATYAYEVSNGNMDFLMTLKAENWWFDMYKQSNVPDKYWVNGREDSRGICQLHRKRHSAIVDNERFFADYKYQVEECWKKYNWWTKFYWYNVRLKYKTHFTIIDK